MKRLPTFGLVALAILGQGDSPAQEQVDKGDTATTNSAAALARMAVRVRVAQAVPAQPAVTVAWRRGGEGLGGQVVRGDFTAEDKSATVRIGAWTAWHPLEPIVGRARGWTFPTVVVGPPVARGKKAGSSNLNRVDVEFEFAEAGRVFQRFTESAPKGATVTFAFAGDKLGPRGSADPDFVANVRGLASYVRARRERLEKLFPEGDPVPKQFGVIGRLGGYGEGAGRGVRHCNPDIVLDECRTLRLLGVNGLLRNSVSDADAAGLGREFRTVYWSGQSGHPKVDCPFQPTDMAARVTDVLADIRHVGAKEAWAQKGDEIGVAAKEHIATCPRCAAAFRDYMRSQNIQPADVGAATWADVKPYPLCAPAASGGKGKGRENLTPAPTNPPDALRYYYTYRFMTFATAPLYRDNTKRLRPAGIPLFSMMGPTPSWGGHSLDWHEFYDLGANSAVVFETSNRDPQVWQFESYLADIARGIAARHDIPFGCLIKPHRGAPEQRMLSVVSRGAGVFEWYTYGPDYSKGDSFSQSPELLEKVARAGRFLGRAEGYLYGAKRAIPAEVAFVSPRSSEIWGKATDLGVTAFEDAKWVYLSLAHAHVPVDVLSEQQLADGKLDGYKTIYVVGPNLRRDAADKLLAWVKAGGLLWTDALGLSRDEANQPAAALADVLPAAGRRLETWGKVEPYRAINIKPFDDPPSMTSGVSWNGHTIRAVVGREPLTVGTGKTVARFTDEQPAVVRYPLGKGEVVAAGLWAGLTYSAKVRRADFDMRADFDAAVRDLIAGPAIERGVNRPVVQADAVVEAVYLQKDGKRSVALMNWGYKSSAAAVQVVENLRVALPGVADLKTVRSLGCGKLTVTDGGVTLPRLAEIDLLILE